MSLETVQILLSPEEFDAIAIDGGFLGGTNLGEKSECAVVGLLRTIGFPEAKRHEGPTNPYDVYTRIGSVEVKSHLSSLHPATPISSSEMAECKFLCKVWSDLSSGWGLQRQHPKFTFYIRQPVQRKYIHYDTRYKKWEAYGEDEEGNIIFR